MHRSKHVYMHQKCEHRLEEWYKDAKRLATIIRNNIRANFKERLVPDIRVVGRRWFFFVDLQCVDAIDGYSLTYEYWQKP